MGPSRTRTDGPTGVSLSLTTADIQLRDPFVLPIEEERTYYLFGSTDADIWRGPGTGFDCYRSRDLATWEGPYPAFRPAPDFWAETNFWAPEVHRYRGRYYLLATFKADGVRRGTQVLVADAPIGPFVPHSDGPVTPRDWECLDGTLHVERDGQPWMVFCHEWVQAGDGRVLAMPLSEDLATAAGEPRELFRASQAPWAQPVHSERHGTGHVTDGPFLHRTGTGELLMLWASFVGGRYAQGLARSSSGDVTGPWEHEPDPLYEGDGGHGMVFRRFDGELVLTLHSPNRTPEERAQFIAVREVGGTLEVVGS